MLDDQAPSVSGGAVAGAPLAPAAVAVVDLSALAQLEASRSAAGALEPAAGFAQPEGEHEEPHSPLGEGVWSGPLDAIRTDVPSPGVLSSFPGLDDIPNLTTHASVIPPDTDGAVGPTRIFNTLNNNYRILNKANGATVATVSIDAFWSSVGAGRPFDPRALYDPYQARFIVSAASNAQSTGASVVVGVSATDDPAGMWTLARYQLGATPCAGGVSCWADFPTLGFNQTWVAVSANMFSIAGSSFRESRVNVFDYASLRSGIVPADQVFVTEDFSVHPVLTYSSTEPVLYAPVHVSSGGRNYRLNTITGSAGAPQYTQGMLKTHVLLGSWTDPACFGCSELPQAPDPATGTTAEIDPGDARVLNAVFRNGAVWYTQTVALPAGGSPTRTAAQWVALDRFGDDLNGGRIDDPTATATNGGKWYAYPSLAVNANSDVLLGFSEFSASEFPSAAYALRAGSDPAGTMRMPSVAKQGDGYYEKTFGAPRNRWGDYSASQVDPVDDLSMWTVQEYAKPRIGGTSFWGTWWVKVAPSAPVSNPLMGINAPASGSVVGRPFSLIGWAIDLGAPAGTGVDAVHVYAYPPTGSPQFLGAATYGLPRSDVAGAFGAQFANAGYSLSISTLGSGTYTIAVFARSTVTGTFNQAQTVVVTVPASDPLMAVERPTPGAAVGQAFTVSGWAVDRGSTTGAGVDVVHVYVSAVLGDDLGAPVFLGAAPVGIPRPDVGAAFGDSRFANSGYALPVSSTLAPGAYRLLVFAHSTVTGTFNQARAVDLVVASDPLMVIDRPIMGAVVSAPFSLAGWAVDRAASSGTGVDAIHVYAYGVTNGVVGAPMFLGVAALGGSRPDVAAALGAARFTNSGYTYNVAGLVAGQYLLVAYARSAVTGTFNQARAVLVTVQ